MRINPELKRYQWLEFSLHRVVAMPFVLAVIFFLSYKAGEWKAVSSCAETIFLAMMFLWGGHKAAQSVLEEVNENTWDFQRLSSLSPWTLAWGKLLGAPSYCWYGALMLLPVYALATLDFMAASFVLHSLFFMLVGTLLCHATALFFSLLDVASGSHARSKKTIIGYHLLGMFAGWSFVSSRFLKPETAQQINWYGNSFDLINFASVFGFLFLLWVIAGIYWQMRVQLRMRTGPWLWVAFILFVVCLVGGFDSSVAMTADKTPFSDASMSFTALRSYGICSLFLYVALFVEPWGKVSYRKLNESWKRRDWVNIADRFPRWVASFILMLLAMVWLCITHISDATTLLTIFAVLSFITRDIALYHFFKLRINNRRATTTTLFYLFVLYMLIPFLLGVLKLYSIVPIFIPVRYGMDDGKIILSLISGACQTAFLGVHAYLRIKRND